MANIPKKIAFYLPAVVFSFFLVTENAFAQPKAAEEKGPDIRLGETRFQVRELGSPPSQLSMLEIQIEILNRSSRSTAPPNSIKVLVTPKEMTFPEGTPVTEYSLIPEEVSLSLPLPPATGRVLIIGFSLLEAKPESITFEIQMNPPDGEKKTVKWEGSGN